MPRSVVLLSGGLDSATCLAMVRAEGLEVIAVSFRYGQRHERELAAARSLAAHYGIERHYLFEVGMFRQIGHSALTGDGAVPKGDRVEDIRPGIAATYVPARNTVFLSHALGVAEVEDADEIVIGVNGLDHDGYPDCRPAFIEAFERMANLATAASTDGRRALRVRAPLLRNSKEDVVRAAARLGVPFHLTHSCYHPNDAGEACGHCDSCLLRLEAFLRAGLVDPIRYAADAA